MRSMERAMATDLPCERASSLYRARVQAPWRAVSRWQSSADGRPQGGSPWTGQAEDQESDDQQVGEVEDDADAEGRRVVAEMIVEDARKPAAEGHAAHGGEEHQRDAPRGFGGGKQVADRHRVGGDDSAEAEPEGS